MVFQLMNTVASVKWTLRGKSGLFMHQCCDVPLD